MKDICNEIESTFFSGDKEKRQNIFSLNYKMRQFVYQEEYNFSLESLQSMMDLERKVSHAKGPKKKYIENTILESMRYLSHQLFELPEIETRLVLDQHLIESETDAKRQIHHTIGLEILNFCKELFDLKINRDAYNSKRKRHILEILSCLAYTYQIPQAFTLSNHALHSKKPDQIYGALEFYSYHFDDLNDDEKAQVIQTAFDIVPNAETRSIAVSALQFLVDINEIGELDALCKIDDWKEQHEDAFI